ncbi:MAG: DUF6285 domain-containing protein [Gammaproteobacteria bacterium]|jgi:hypothetical protein
MQDRPTSSELLGALADFLDNEMLPQTEGPLQYRVRVASSLAKILQREQEFGNQMLVRERGILCRLLAISPEELAPGSLADQVEDLNHQLVTTLEDGEFSVEFEGAAWHALMEITRDKLAIVRPGYDGFDGSGERP